MIFSTESNQNWEMGVFQPKSFTCPTEKLKSYSARLCLFSLGSENRRALISNAA